MQTIDATQMALWALVFVGAVLALQNLRTTPKAQKTVARAKRPVNDVMYNKLGPYQSPRAVKLLLSQIDAQKQRGYSQEEIAKLAGVAPVMISKYRTKNVRPTKQTYDKIKRALDDIQNRPFRGGL